MEFTKSTIDSYKIIPGGDDHNRCMWAIVNIDNDNWTFTATSDCGDYSYRWCVESQRTFKKLLSGLNEDYFLGKVSERSWIDEDLTIKNAKEYIIQGRKEGFYKKEEARELYDAVKDLESGNCDDTFEREFFNIFGFDDGIDPQKDFPMSAKTFFDVIFKPLQQIFLSELANNEVTI